jgi:hypothetical protein
MLQPDRKTGQDEERPWSEPWRQTMCALVETTSCRACQICVGRASRMSSDQGALEEECISRESNPGHIDGNDVFYH